MTPKLICILGAESTGKTTLARQLAVHFDCPWVPEYLRAFCDERGRTPYRDEQALILETQHVHELAAAANARAAAPHAAGTSGLPFVFCDTAPLTTAIYSDYVFGDHSLYARARMLHQRYALTLLCMPDLGWVADGFLRDSADAQLKIHDMMARELTTLGLPFAQVKGGGNLRLDEAVKALTHSAR